MSSQVIIVIKISWKVSESEKKTGVWRQHLTMQSNLDCQNRIAWQNEDTCNASVVET